MQFYSKNHWSKKLCVNSNSILSSLGLFKLQLAITPIGTIHKWRHRQNMYFYVPYPRHLKIVRDIKFFFYINLTISNTSFRHTPLPYNALDVTTNRSPMNTIPLKNNPHSAYNNLNKFSCNFLIRLTNHEHVIVNL